MAAEEYLFFMDMAGRAMCLIGFLILGTWIVYQTIHTVYQAREADKYLERIEREGFEAMKKAREASKGEMGPPPTGNPKRE